MKAPLMLIVIGAQVLLLAALASRHNYDEATFQVCAILIVVYLVLGLLWLERLFRP